MLILGCFLTFLTAMMLVSRFPPPTRIGLVLAVAGVCIAQIVLLSVLLSELGQMRQGPYMAGHMLFFLLGLGLWRRVSWDFRPAPMDGFLLVLVLGISFFNLAYSWGNLPLSGDAYSYHLPRSYFWAQNGTAHYFEAFLPYWNEYPPNPSFYFTWIMLLRADVGDWGLQVPQWLAGWLCAVAVMGWVRLLGHSRSNALWVGLAVLMLPMVSVQMRSIEIDLLTTCTGLAAFYFAGLFLQGGNRAALAYAGLHMGLFLGSKYTAFFWLPTLGLVLLAWAGRRRWLALGLSFGAGFLLLGSYSYLQNMLEIGNPISSRSAVQITAGVEPERLDDYFSFTGNGIRYSYMVMDWGMFPHQNPLSDLHTDLYRRLGGQNLESIYKFSLADYGRGRRTPNRVGFGLLGYALYLLSPVALLIFGGLAWRQKRADYALAAAYVAIGLGWVLWFLLLMPWDPYRMRYFPLVILPLMAGILPWFWRWRWVWMGLSLCMGADAAYRAFDPVTVRDLRQSYAIEFDILAQLLPPKTRIGLVDPTIAYVTIANLPQFDYVILNSEEAEARLEAGEVDAVLETIQPGKSTGFKDRESVVLYLPELIFNLRMREAEALRARFRSLYAWDESGAAYQPQRVIQHWKGELVLNLLDEGLSKGDDFMIRLAPAPHPQHIACEGRPVDYYQRGDELRLFWTSEARAPYQLFQSCQIALAAVADPILGLWVEKDHAPPPEVGADLYFNGELNYRGFVLSEGYELARCGVLPVVTWWGGEALPQADYTMSLVMVSPEGDVASKDERPLRPQSGEFFRRQILPIPCGLPSGLYDLKFGLFDASALQDYPITHPDGSPHGRGVHLTTVFVP